MATDSSTRTAQRPGGRGSSVGRRVLKIGLAFVTAVLLLNLLGNRGLPAVLQARREFEREGQSLDRLKTENDRLRSEIQRLRVDDEAVEEAARRDLGYIAPGEKLFIITDVPPADAAPPAPSTGNPPSEPPPSR